VKYILFTHAHEDHFYPCDLHRTYPPYAYSGPKEPIGKINVYGNKAIAKYAGEFEKHREVLEFFVSSYLRSVICEGTTRILRGALRHLFL
jgi:ribonuclease BN (tRNA processing enzyme)